MLTRSSEYTYKTDLKNKIQADNNFYLSYITEHRNMVLTDTGSISALRHELLTGEHSGVRLSASKSRSVAKKNALTAKKGLYKVFTLLGCLQRLGAKNSGEFKAFTLVISPQSAKLATIERKGVTVPGFTDNQGNNPFDRLNDMRKQLNNKIKKYLQPFAIKSEKMTVSPYMFMTNDEYTITNKTALNGVISATMNQHIHGLLIVPTAVKSDELKAYISNIVAGYGDDVYFNMASVTTDYININRPGKASLVVKTGQMNTDQQSDLTSLHKIITYQNKQPYLPKLEQPMHDNNGQKSHLLQGEVFNRINARLRGKTVLACVNTMFNNTRHQSTGLVRTKQLKKLAQMVLIQLIQFKKHRSPLITLNRVRTSFKTAVVYYSFKGLRTKPPP